MDFIKITERKTFNGTVSSSSSSDNDTVSAQRVLEIPGYWTTLKRDFSTPEHLTIDFGENIAIDFVKLFSSFNGTTTFPKSFRLEAGINNKDWKIIYSEFDTSLRSTEHEINLPLTVLRYLRLVIIESAVVSGKYFSEIGRIEAGLSGIESISSSSSNSDNVPVKLIDGNPHTFWESENTQKSAKEILNLDLGKIYHINKILMSSGSEGFPDNFKIEVSPDAEIWTPVVQEKTFNAKPGERYFWDIGTVKSRHVRIECFGTQLNNNNYAVKISEIELFAADTNYGHIHNMKDITPYSSVFQAGIVKLAKDGESLPGSAVQSTDGRLREASTVFKGIVQLANDGDITKGLVVQSDDSRLTPASEQKHGIVRLAYNRETNENAVVQANDSRLQHADDDNFGIVRLCPDGDYKEHSVVTGNDKRLQKSTTSEFGICRLAEDGASEAGSVVQSNDRRLKDASSFNPGIVRLAEDGEIAAEIAVQANDSRLMDANTTRKGIVELAENGEDREGVVVQGNDKRLKNATTTSKGIVEFAEDGEEKPNTAVQGNDKRLKDATVNNKGIAELAEDGEDREGVVVQGNDKRLKEATEISSGIMKFAVDGGTGEFTAVQGNDKRLKDATTISKGIVELAEDGEDREGVVVQGNDKRLKDASTDNKGIVQFAENGEVKPNVAVQADDLRLRDATINNKGIVQLAGDGEQNPNVAVQGNDKRLKNASELSSGIMKFAVDGGTGEFTAVQGNDKRLKDATTISKGIVELAEDGEDREGVVVQGNDKRLKEASNTDPGIVKLAGNGESHERAVVQSTDSRLSNKREPLPHEHDYAPKNHNYSTHSGTIAIKAEKSEFFNDITPPSDGSSVIYGKNTSNSDHVIGLTGIAGLNGKDEQLSYGVIGHGKHVGVRGQAPGTESSGAGIVGVSRFGSGGIFSSEHGFSLIADGSGKKLGKVDKNIQLMGDKKALYADGYSEFNGSVKINGDESSDIPGGIVELFEVDEVAYVSPGDILIVSEKGESTLSKSRNSFNKSVLGVVSGNPKIIIDNSGKKEKLYPVALSGKVLCKVDARNNPINPGDLIVTSDTAGCGMAGKIDSFDKIGTVIGKALDGLNDGVDLIPVFVMHQ